jgi:RNA 2',3'-cyclic 3'-phosphodiesterase
VFFALWPQQGEQRALAQAAHRAAAASGGRPVPEASLHVTLAFLGSVPPARIPELDRIAREVAAQFCGESRPPPLTFDALAHWAKPQVLAVLAREEPRLAGLAARLKDLTAAAGFRPDLKPFHAHVTVARKVVHASAAARSLRAVSWRCDGFALVDSRTESAGPVYSVIESFPLVKAENARG